MANNPPPDPQFYPNYKRKKPKFYSLIIMLIPIVLAGLLVLGIAIQKGCNNEKNMDKNQTLDS